MNGFHHRVLPNWEQSLVEVLAHARTLGEAGLLAFDLDSTLFDNRPRQARIIREFGQARALPQLTRCGAEHFTSGWDLRGPLTLLGLTDAQIDHAHSDLSAFWRERFFTSPYCLEDVPIEGAVAFVQAVHRTGATLCYLTGRHEGMRVGTEGSLSQGGFPTPGGRVHLIMKPALEGSDDDFKREAHARLRRMGQLIAAFDNEPMHANDYRRNFPEARVVHLATDHSGRPVELLEGIVSVPNFRLGA